MNSGFSLSILRIVTVAASVHRIFEVVRWKNLGLTLDGKAYFVEIDTFLLTRK